MSIRCQCVKILQQIIEEKCFFNILKSDVTEHDLPFANMLILTSLRQMSNLEQVINSLLHKKIPNKHKAVYYVLLCACTEIIFLDTPDYAVINEYVNCAKKITDRFTAGMVNAVLRKITLQKETLKDLSPKIPDTFARIISNDYGSQAIDAIRETISKPTPLDIITKENPEEWAEKLNGTLLANGTIRLNNCKTKIPALAGYAQGQWWVQDLAASLPVLLLGDITGKKILDLCAAPGGKTAQLLAGDANVTALDIDTERMQRLYQNITRLGLEKNLQTIVGDGIKFLTETDELFDIIVVDAPCSATGTFRRHPEVMYIKEQADIHNQLLIQQDMLSAATSKVKSGGKILYCTCSLAKAEGENQIKSFLQVHRDFKLLPADMSMINRFLGTKIEDKVIDKGILRTLPYHMSEIGGMDSFFAAVLQKD